MPCDACHTNLADASFNYVVSSNVLEHIPPDIIRGILKESRRILKPEGLHLHHINPGDHSAFDPHVTTVNFLRYSPRAWYLLGGSGIAYHNRLRCTDYIKLLEDGGFRVVHQIRAVDQKALELLRSGTMNVHKDFMGYSSEELACDLIDVFAVLT